MASRTTRLMSFEEYLEIRNLPEGHYELHHGELVHVSFPKKPHVRAQCRLCRLLEQAAGPDGFVTRKFLIGRCPSMNVGGPILPTCP